MTRWFYRIMGDELGPISTSQLINAIIKNRISSDTDIRKATDSEWTPALYVEGLFAAVDKRRAEYDQEEAKEQSRWENLRVSTCGPLPGKQCRVIDTLFAMDSSGEAGFLSHTEANPDEAFAKVKEQLRRRAFELGADAVVSCQFEYRFAITTNERAAAIANWAGVNGGHSQCVEIFAYGTAIKYEE